MVMGNGKIDKYQKSVLRSYKYISFTYTVLVIYVNINKYIIYKSNKYMDGLEG